MRNRDSKKRKMELRPQVPAEEAWLYGSPKALFGILEGIEQADRGQLSEQNLDLSQFKEEDLD